VIHDFIKARIALFEFAANVPDDRSDVHSKASVACTSDEAFVVQAVVDGTIRHVPTKIRGEEVYNFILPHRKSDILLIPKCPAYCRPQMLAADQWLLGGLDQPRETPDENLDASRSVTEADPAIRCASKGG
jgi:hypothetical protein